MSPTLQASVFMGKNYSENSLSIKNSGKDLTMKQMFDISEKSDIQIRSMDMEWIQLTWKILHGSIYLWLVMKTSADSCIRIFRSCVMIWKDERQLAIKYCLGRQVEVFQKFISLQSFGHNWWWANGIRVEYIPRIHYISACPWSPRVTVKNERRARRIPRTDHPHVGVQRHFLWIWRKKQECDLSANLVSI